jgi:hypothetical protein
MPKPHQTVSVYRERWWGTELQYDGPYRESPYAFFDELVPFTEKDYEAVSKRLGKFSGALKIVLR